MQLGHALRMMPAITERCVEPALRLSSIGLATEDRRATAQ
jgi:hypothetical protein